MPFGVIVENHRNNAARARNKVLVRTCTQGFSRVEPEYILSCLVIFEMEYDSDTT